MNWNKCIKILFFTAVGIVLIITLALLITGRAHAQQTLDKNCVQWRVKNAVTGDLIKDKVSSEDVVAKYNVPGNYKLDCVLRKSLAVNISPLGSEEGKPDDLVGYIVRFYNFALLISGALALLMITAGGLLIAFSGAIDKKSEGREMIKAALWGLALLFGANLILRTVNPQLVTLKEPHTDEVLVANDVCNVGSEHPAAKGVTTVCGYKEFPKFLDLASGGKICSCLLSEQPDNTCSLDNVGNHATVLASCIPRRVELFSNGGQELTNFLTLFHFPEESNGTISLKPLSSKIKNEKNNKDLENGIMVYRAPFYKAVDKRPSASGESTKIGPETAQCLVYAFKVLDESGEKKKLVNFRFGSRDVVWKPCAWDEAEVRNAIDLTKNQIRFKPAKGEEEVYGFDPATLFMNLQDFVYVIGQGSYVASGGGEIATGGDGSQILSGPQCDERRAAAQKPGLLTHQEASNKLRLVGNILTNRACTDVCGVQSCTSLDGIPERVVGGLIALKNRCGGCKITVTGGTEIDGHIKGGTHGPGGTAIDVAIDPKLNEYINERVSAMGNPTSNKEISKKILKEDTRAPDKIVDSVVNSLSGQVIILGAPSENNALLFQVYGIKQICSTPGNPRFQCSAGAEAGHADHLHIVFY